MKDDNGNEIKGLAVAYDGCHKIYICETEADIERMKELGYQINEMSELEDIYNKSCSLRFIDSADLKKCFVAQKLEDDGGWF